MAASRPHKPRKTTVETNRKIRAGVQQRIRATALGPEHPAVEAAADWLALRESPYTASTSATNIVNFFNYCARTELDPLAITRRDAKRYLIEQQDRGYAPATLALRATILRTFYADSVDEDIVSANPFYRVKAGNNDPVTKTPSLTLEQCGRLAAVCRLRIADAALVSQRDGAMAYLMMRVGPRRMEVASATWGLITPQGDGLAWQIRGKGEHWDTTSIPADAASVVNAWRGSLETAIGRPVRPEDAVFPYFGRHRSEDLPARFATGALEPLGRSAVSITFKEMLAEIGATGRRYSAHAARATAATHAYAATKDLVGVQRMLRHKQQSTTLRYIRDLNEESPAGAWLPPDVPTFEDEPDEDPGTEAA